MPGTAKTNQFLLSTATVMIGPQADLHQLNATDHSIGLVKNFQMTTDPQFIELTQGITNTIVMSVKTQENVSVSMEVYEYTLRNLTYATGLDASGSAFDPITGTYPLASGIAADATTVTVTGTPSGIATGDWIFIQEGLDDLVHIAKVASATGSSITLAAGWEVPHAFTTAARVGKVRKVELGRDSTQAELAAKVVGILPAAGEPFTLLFPRVKITGGLGVAFSSENFGNLPFEFTPYAGVTTDPFYSEYGSANAVLFPR